MTPERKKLAEQMLREGRSVEDIAKRFGMSNTTVYNHFPGNVISALRRKG